MGREIRLVPPNWEHPKKERYDYRLGRYVEEYQPMRNQDVEETFAEWTVKFQAWLAGEHDRVIAEHGEADYPKNEPYRAFCHWHGGPPDPEYYRPKWPDGYATWFQVYETVSEGTPVTPPFATQEELIEYLVANGDFWDQKRMSEGITDMECQPWSREAAERFVRRGHAFSLVVEHTSEGVVVKGPSEQ